MNNCSKSTLCISALLTLAATSCVDNYDWESARRMSTDYAYMANFKEVYGVPDPDQDYNMATRVTATVALSDVTGAQFRVYTDCPIYADSYLLADYSNLEGNAFSFDAEKGMSQVFVTVYRGNEELFAGYCNIENSAITISEGSKASRSARRVATRADQYRSSAYKDITFTDDVMAKSAVSKYSIYGVLYTYEELVQMVINRGNLWWTSPFDPNTCRTYDQWGNPTGWDFTNAKLVEGEYSIEKETFKINLTYLMGVETRASEPWTLSLGRQLFGPGTFFQEQVNYYGGSAGSVHPTPSKVSLYGNSKTEQKEMIRKIEQGFAINTTGGEIEMPFIYGATEINDQIGYIYYQDGQDPLAQPHYILIKDGRPASNLFFNGWKSAGTAVGNMQLANWNDTEIGSEENPLFGYSNDTKVYGTTYKLTFFGPNHDQEGSYYFPAGYHIVFFIHPCDTNGSENVWDWRGTNRTADFNYSLPELNARIESPSHHHNWNGTTNDIPEGTEDCSAGARKAVSWTTLGMTFLGFEDGGRDEDLNDAVFWINGEYERNTDPIKIPDSIAQDTVPETTEPDTNPGTIEPEPDPTPIVVPTQTQDKPHSWVIACEDLGATDDFDFNDVVFRVTHVSGQNTITMTPLAAGGTLGSIIYRGNTAIGEIHKLFSPYTTSNLNISGEFDMLNTSKGANLQGNNPQTINLSESEAQSFSMSSEGGREAAGGFKIKVVSRGKDVNDTKEGSFAAVVNAPVKGSAPQMLILPSNWIWPIERCPIGLAYPAFTNWVTDTYNTDWSSYYDAEGLVQKY